MDSPPTGSTAPNCADLPSARDQLTRKLKENESQRLEITSQINQLCIQLHRWKLRLQTLNERKCELEAEVQSLQKRRAS
jgi:chromosome segregation ATPase